MTTTTQVVESNEMISIQDQCDYNLLFSHLPASFSQLVHIQIQHLIINNTAVAINFPDGGVQKLCYALVALCFGLFYSLIGYRFLKLSAFIVGFALGSAIIYLILAEQKQLTLVENLIISLSIGCLFAFVALLVQYIGLFLLGITSSISLVTCILIVIDLFHTNKSAWLCILLMFSCATLVASITLKFQKSCTIFNTSAIGSGLLLFAIDYFVENNLLLDYIFELYKVNGNSFNIFERQKALLNASPRPTIATTPLTFTTKTLSNSSNIQENSALALFLHLYSSAHARLCWYTWLIFGIYFLLLILSILVQYLITGKDYDHRDSWQKLIRGSRKKKSANLEKIRLKSHVNEPKSTKQTAQQQQQLQQKKQQKTDSLTSATNTDRLSLSGQSIESVNDTLLLVTNEIVKTHASPPKKKTKRQKHDLEIVSFEVIKSPSSNKKKSTKTSKSPTNSSTSSSSSSTCQLIQAPPQNRPEPSAPPAPTTETTQQKQQQLQQPPPVPSQPPPKLPSIFAASNSSTKEVQLQTNLAKIKQHRSNSGSSKKECEKFRYFYQVRRNNGDVLSQDFMNNFQSKIHSSSNLNATEDDQEKQKSRSLSSKSKN